MGIFGDAFDRVADQAVEREFSARGIGRSSDWRNCGCCSYRAGPSGNYWVCARHQVRTYDSCICSSFEGGPSQYRLEGKKSGCFLTTIACELSGLDDDCEELTALRWYRDSVLTRDDRGRAILSEYDRMGPALADAIRSSEGNKALAESLLDAHIRPAVKAVRRGDYPSAEKAYREMVSCLLARFGSRIGPSFT